MGIEFKRLGRLSRKEASSFALIHIQDGPFHFVFLRYFPNNFHKYLLEHTFRDKSAATAQIYGGINICSKQSGAEQHCGLR